MKKLLFILLLITLSCSNDNVVESQTFLEKATAISTSWESQSDSNVLSELSLETTSPFTYFIDAGSCYIKTDLIQVLNLTNQVTVLQNTADILELEATYSSQVINYKFQLNGGNLEITQTSGGVSNTSVFVVSTQDINALNICS